MAYSCEVWFENGTRAIWTTSLKCQKRCTELNCRVPRPSRSKHYESHYPFALYAAARLDSYATLILIAGCGQVHPRARYSFRRRQRSAQHFLRTRRLRHSRQLRLHPGRQRQSRFRIVAANLCGGYHAASKPDRSQHDVNHRIYKLRAVRDKSAGTIRLPRIFYRNGEHESVANLRVSNPSLLRLSAAFKSHLWIWSLGIWAVRLCHIVCRRDFPSTWLSLTFPILHRRRLWDRPIQELPA